MRKIMAHSIFYWASAQMYAVQNGFMYLKEYFLKDIFIIDADAAKCLNAYDFCILYRLPIGLHCKA